jgi:tRNA/tmRNA/rRNA uracil-C5-methylase (TrmA/RlmC/RlmD family)
MSQNTLSQSSFPPSGACRLPPLSHAHVLSRVEASRDRLYCRCIYMTVQGMQQQLQSSVLMQLHFPP